MSRTETETENIRLKNWK